jgi:hypothetical protein
MCHSTASNQNIFMVTKPDGTVYEFKQSESGLYYYDLALNKCSQWCHPG